MKETGNPKQIPSTVASVFSHLIFAIANEGDSKPFATVI